MARVWDGAGLGGDRSGNGDGRATRGRRGSHGLLDDQVVQAFGEGGTPRRFLQPDDLLEECPRLVGEELLAAVADAGEAHGQAAGDVGMLRVGEHRAVAAGDSGDGAVDEGELGVRARSNDAAPSWPNTSNASPLGWPSATRDTEKVPAAPLANLTVKVAMSSLVTAARSRPVQSATVRTADEDGIGQAVDHINFWCAAEVVNSCPGVPKVGELLRAVNLDPRGRTRARSPAKGRSKRASYS